MEYLSLEKGRVVYSTQGRDRGRYFIVLDRPRPDLVLVADGETHLLSAPKKKNPKHLKAKPVLIDLEKARPEGGPLQDSDLRRVLLPFGLKPEPTLCKED